MSTHTPSDQFDPNVEECLRLYKCWPWFLGLGVLLIVAGAVAVGSPHVAQLTTYFLMVLFGWLLLAGGVVEIVNAFVVRTWRGFFLHLLAGVLHLVVGGLLVEHPVRGAEVLTLMLAVAFLVGGTFRLVGAVAVRFSGWVWVALNGAITLALGVAIWRSWPGSSDWVIGLFVGIDLIFDGWSWVMLGLMVKAAAPGGRPAEPQAQTGITAGVS
jgi:uncharacterized membrane protein HdeD (DUF308 family)